MPNLEMPKCLLVMLLVSSKEICLVACAMQHAMVRVFADVLGFSQPAMRMQGNLSSIIIFSL
jgi:hypothetical protein